MSFSKLNNHMIMMIMIMMMMIIIMIINYMCQATRLPFLLAREFVGRRLVAGNVRKCY